MTKENQNQLAVNLLTEINAVNPDRFQEMKVFFSEAFLLHTSEEVFDDSWYRQQWADLINVMRLLSKVFENTNPELAKLQLRRAIDTLSGKEVTHE